MIDPLILIELLIGFSYEKNVPTQCDQKKKNPWIQSANGNQKRPSSVKQTSCKRQKAINCIDNFVKVTFSREHRIITKKEFKHIFDDASKISQKHLFILYKPNQLPSARLGLSIGKRIAKSAVVRNRIKRIIRESFRAHRMNLKKVDIVVIARQPCDKLSNQNLREGIDKLWEKLGNA